MSARNNNMAEVWGIWYPKWVKLPDGRYNFETDEYRRAKRIVGRARNTCSVCGSRKTRLENHSAMWGDGDVMCENGHHVRDWDSG